MFRYVLFLLLDEFGVTTIIDEDHFEVLVLLQENRFDHVPVSRGRRATADRDTERDFLCELADVVE